MRLRPFPSLSLDFSSFSKANELTRLTPPVCCPETVVKNPLSPVEHRGGEGVKNELFELGLDQFVRGLM